MDRADLVRHLIDQISVARAVGDLMVVELRKPAPDLPALLEDLKTVLEAWDRVAASLSKLWNLTPG